MTPLFLLIAVSGYTLQEGVTPVQKVINLLNGMASKGRAEMELEATHHSEYIKWCEQTDFEKKVAIRDGKADMERLSAAIEKADADASTLGDEINALNQQINTWSAEKKQATEIRTKSHADYEVVHTEYNDNLDAMSAALSTLAAKSSGSIGNSFVQELNNHMSTKGRTALAAFLQEDREVQMPTAPAGNAFEFSSSSIVDTVNQLKEKMEDERSAVEKEEANAHHAFQMVEQQLTMDIESANEERDNKVRVKTSRHEDSAADRGDLEETTISKEADEKYLAGLVAQCQTKSSEFADRQQLRKDELTALAKATEIISGGSVSGAADTHLPALVQKVSFGLLRSKATPMQKRVAAFLQDRATQSASRVLALVATKIADGPFDKVKSMIEAMITKLTEEAADEADHKGWCDGEMASNKQMREAKTEEVDRLTALSEKLNAEIDRLNREIADLAGQINALNAALSEATEQRNKDKAANTATVADAKDAIVAVRQATQVLKQFYSTAATATSFVQVVGPADDAPTSWDSSYTGQQSSSTGVMGLLDVILSDFVRLESETSSGEQEAADEFRSFSGSSNDDIASKQATTDAKDKETKKKEKDLNEAKKDLRSTQEELDSAMEYFDKLKPSCVDAGVSYSDRVQRRQDEIDSLKDALQILTNEM